MNLGGYGDLSLADARKTAKELRARVALGYDVAGEKKERKRVAVAKIEAQKLAVTVAQLADDYFERMILGRWKHPEYSPKPYRERHQAEYRQVGCC